MLQTFWFLGKISMRKNALLLIGILWFTFALTWSQAGPPPSHKILSDPNLFADAHLHGLDQQVHLSDEQKAKIRPVFVAEGQKLISIMNDNSLSADQRQKQIEQLHERTRDKVASMLTASQLKLFNNTPKLQNPGPESGKTATHQI
jgi:hypothetical protein